MKHFVHKQVGAVLALAAVSLVLGAGTAAAYRVPDDRPVHSPAAIAAAQSTDLAPDDRAGHHPGSIGTSTPVVAQAAPGDAFDWLDAGIGAGTVFALGLLAIGTSVVVLRSRRGAAFS